MYVLLPACLLTESRAGHLRPLARPYLTRLLESLLNTLVCQGLPLPPRAVPAHALVHALEVEHEIPRRVTQQVLPWFGKVETDGEDPRWEMDVNQVVRQIGVGRLMSHKVRASSRVRARVLRQPSHRMIPSK